MWSVRSRPAALRRRQQPAQHTTGYVSSDAASRPRACTVAGAPIFESPGPSATVEVRECLHDGKRLSDGGLVHGAGRAVVTENGAIPSAVPSYMSILSGGRVGRRSATMLLHSCLPASCVCASWLLCCLAVKRRARCCCMHAACQLSLSIVVVSWRMSSQTQWAAHGLKKAMEQRQRQDFNSFTFYPGLGVLKGKTGSRSLG